MDPQQVLHDAQEALTVRRVFGDPIQADGVTIVPVAIVGGGGGGGSKANDEGGVGYGIRARPAGVFVLKNGHVSWRPAVNVNLIVAGAQLVAVAAIVMARSVLNRWLRERRHAPAISHAL